MTGTTSRADLERVVSAYGAEILAMLGATRVYNLEGGIEEWGRLGYPLEGSKGTQPAQG